MNAKHIATNLVTGEVMMTNRANHLKRWVARTERWNIAHGYGKGEWVFAHGTNAYDRLHNKATAILGERAGF